MSGRCPTCPTPSKSSGTSASRSCLPTGVLHAEPAPDVADDDVAAETQQEDRRDVGPRERDARVDQDQRADDEVELVERDPRPTRLHAEPPLEEAFRAVTRHRSEEHTSELQS